jgi:hypothetical protein
MSKSEMFEAMRQEQPGGLASAGVAAAKQTQTARAPLSTLLDSATTAQLRSSWKEPPAAPQPVREGPPPQQHDRQAPSASSDPAAGHGRARHIVADDSDDDGDDPPTKVVVPYTQPVQQQLTALPTAFADPSAKAKPLDPLRPLQGGAPVRKALPPSAVAAPVPPSKPMSDRSATKPLKAMRQQQPCGLAKPVLQAKVAQGQPTPLAARLDNAATKRAPDWKQSPSAQRSAKDGAALSRSGQPTQTAIRGAVGSKGQARSSDDDHPPARAAMRAPAPNGPLGPSQRTTTTIGAIGNAHRADPAAARDPLDPVAALRLPDDQATDLAFDAVDLAIYLVALNPEAYAALQRTCPGALRSIAQFAIDSCGGAGRVNAVALRRMFKSGVLSVDVRGRPTVDMPDGGTTTWLAARSLAATLARSCGVTAAGCPRPECALGTLRLPAAVMAEAARSTPS